MSFREKILLVSFSILFSIISSAQTTQNNFYKINRTPFADGLDSRRSHANVDFKFVNTNNQPFTGQILFRYNNEESMIYPDSRGIYNIALSSGNYQFSFKTAFGEKSVTDSVALYKTETAEITVILKTKHRK